MFLFVGFLAMPGRGRNHAATEVRHFHARNVRKVQRTLCAPTKPKTCPFHPPYEASPPNCSRPSPSLAMSLNPEPSAPEERAEHHLPPKSYADAAEEALEPQQPQSHANGTDGTAEHHGKKILGKANEVKTNGIKVPSEEDKTSLEGLGQEPRSPTVKGHRRVSSRGSHGSLGRKQGEQVQKDMNGAHTNGNGKGNGNGDVLTSVKPQQEFQVAKADRRTDLKRRNSELTTGRQAGAGWSQSK